MKKNLIFAGGLLMSFFLTQNAASAQSPCTIMKDTLVMGSGDYDYSTWTYNQNYRPSEIIHINAVNPNNSRRDTAYYNANGSLNKVQSFWLNNNMLYATMELEYTGNKVSRINESGENGNGAWTKSYDLTYNGADILTDMKLDPFSITGSPEGMLANFENMTFTNGNVTYCELVADFGMGTDRLELNLSYDNKNALAAKKLMREAPDLLFNICANNMTVMTLVNDEFAGNAGDIAMQFNYTYNTNNDVVTQQEVPGLFNSQASTVRYDWDCSGAGFRPVNQLEFTLYPNPASDFVNIMAPFQDEGEFIVFTLDGQYVTSGELNGITHLRTNDWARGMYVISIQTSEAAGNTRFILR